MHILLPPELERRIAEKVDAGLYASASEVVRDGLSLLFEDEENIEHRRARLAAEIDIGIAELDRGLGMPGGEVMAELKAKLDAKHASR